jgi:hypothetical protein
MTLVVRRRGRRWRLARAVAAFGEGEGGGGSTIRSPVDCTSVQGR